MENFIFCIKNTTVSNNRYDSIDDSRFINQSGQHANFFFDFELWHYSDRAYVSTSENRNLRASLVKNTETGEYTLRLRNLETGKTIEKTYGFRLTENRRYAILAAIFDWFNTETGKTIETAETETAEIASETIEVSETETAEINTAEIETSGEVIELETPEMAGREDIRAFIYREDGEYFLSIYRCDLASDSRIDEWTLRIGKSITKDRWVAITKFITDYVTGDLHKRYNSEDRALCLA